jgi:hypothetical protein
MSQIKILYGNHWPEVVAPLAAQIGAGETLVTEDAPSPEFRQMLAGDLSIDDYLLATDIEFPEFSRRMCRLWRRLDRAGTRIVQVEPFIATLLEIHAFFADGGRPDQIETESIRGRVYQAEREATGALLDFYQASTAADLDTVVDATLRFARCDARRFVLRDRMRAEAIAGLLATHPRLCVEAGQIHLALGRFLRRMVPEPAAVKPVFLMRTIVRRLGREGHLYPPGDQLTLRYIFHPDEADSQRHRLLAARALIYAKVAAKDEISPSPALYSRTLDDLRTIALVNRLSYRDCHEMFATIRRQAGAGARQALAVYLRRP